jgi:septal ring factor EnvC (AmiA/AmiB activator)
MSFRRRPVHFRFAAATAAVATVLGAAATLAFASPSIDQLSSQLSQEQARQQGLAASIGGLSQSIATLSGQIALVQSREAQVQADLVRDRAALAATRSALSRERRLLAVLRAHVAHARMLLSRQLLSSYEGDNPDLVAVVINARGFTDLLDRLTFLHDAERAQQSIITTTRRAKAQADDAALRLAKLEATDREITSATQLRSRALAGMNTLLQSKQGALQSAREAQRVALGASQARGSALRSQISRIQAAEAAARRAAAARAAAAAAAAARAAAASAPVSSSGSSSAGSGSPASAAPALGPSGGWAIPYAIVLCESGGQNLPPNSAGASGYYQILPATWKLFGGSGPAAYLAGKAEQDAVASRIWAGGSGASNWVCAGIVGMH